MNRSGKSKWCAGALVLGWLLTMAGATEAWGQESKSERPNILFCFADDWGRYASVYAQLEPQAWFAPVLRTPHIDALARGGVVFRHAFVPSPSCTPCRSSLLTGRYFFQTGRGAILQGAVWDESLPAMPLLLRQAGYALGKTGKVWGPGTPLDAPIGGQQYAFQQAGMAFQNFSVQVMRALEGGATVEQAKERLLRQVDENFASFLQKRSPQQPFFYWFGPTNTHRLWARGSGKKLWGIDPDQLKGRLPPFLPDVPEVREDLADYLGEVQALDAMIGVLVRRLKQAGEAERTVIVLSGDHGIPGFPRGKCTLYDFGTAVALIVAGPGIPGGRVVDDMVSLMDLAPTFLELGGVQPPKGTMGRSLLPLLRSPASGQIDPTRRYVILGRERHVAEARAGNLPYPHRALRTHDWLYIRNYAPDRWPMGDPKAADQDPLPSWEQLTTNHLVAFADMDAGPTKAWLIQHGRQLQWQQYYHLAFGKRPAEELYDLRNDPHQMRNLAADPQYTAQRQELAGQLERLLREAGDPRLVDKECRYEQPPFTDPAPVKKK
ncbi:MAG: sulfatase [Gemmataceae bacterium]|nr:sulfatase [Gemmataceae bacterium]